MLLEIERDSLLDGLSKSVPITEKKSTLPILSHILFEASDSTLKLTATDLSVGIKLIYECDVKESGTLTIPGKKIHEIVRELPAGLVSMQSSDTGRMKIVSGNSVFELACMDASDYPAFSDLTGLETASIQAEKLLYMVDKTLFASSNDESRFNLNGVLFEQNEEAIRLVATDGHRLALIDENLGMSMSSKVLVPKKGLLELKRMLETVKDKVELGFEQKNMCVKTDRFVMTIRLIEGDYPDYRKVIPEAGEKVIKSDRSKLLQSLRRVAILTSDRNRGVDVTVTRGNIEVVAVHPDLGTAKDILDVEYSGEPFSLLINVLYFIESLSAVDTDEISLEFHKEGSPVIIRPEPLKDYFNLVMPMRK
ncbi:MAG TPA: DNA polymerase III subunit beta [Desulfomonilaceae bacterium]|nr:DNA polymerase III subunit beta [Desulfomonilaceae bacterium]